MKLLNLTPHRATADQLAAGVIDLPDDQRELLQSLMAFDVLPRIAQINDRAAEIAELACSNGLGGDDADSPTPCRAMIGGPHWLMAPLAALLYERRIKPMFAFSVRDRHRGFIPA